MDVPQVTPLDVRVKAAAKELSIEPNPYFSLHEFLNPNNLHTLELFGSPLGEALYSNYLEVKHGEPAAQNHSLTISNQVLGCVRRF